MSKSNGNISRNKKTKILREFLFECKVWNHKLGAFSRIIIGKGRWYLQSNMSHPEYSVDEFEELKYLEVFEILTNIEILPCP